MNTTPNAVTFGSPATETVNYTANLEALTVDGPSDPLESNPQAPVASDAGDTFVVNPSTITINGGQPTAGVGDTLVLSAVGLTNPAISPNPAMPNGQLASTSHKTVAWNSIETLPVPLGLGGTFSFGPSASPSLVQPGFLPVTPADSPTSGAYAFAGVGWTQPGACGFDRTTLTMPNTPQLSNLVVDGEWGYAGGGANNGQFRVAVAKNQDVQVTAFIGDTYAGRDMTNVYVSTSPSGPFTTLNPTLGTFNTAGQSYQYVSYSGAFNPGDNSSIYVTIETVSLRPRSPLYTSHRPGNPRLRRHERSPPIRE